MLTTDLKLKMALGAGTGVTLSSGDVWNLMEAIVFVRNAAEGNADKRAAQDVLKKLEG